MGKIRCDKHGEQGIVLTCSHLRQAILAGTSGPDHVTTARYILGPFSNEDPSFRFAYCGECAKLHGLPHKDGALLHNEIQVADIGEPVCAVCFDAFRK